MPAFSCSLQAVVFGVPLGCGNHIILLFLQVPPLQVLDKQQVLEFLFSGLQSAWERATRAALAHLKGSKQAPSAALSPIEVQSNDDSASIIYHTSCSRSSLDACVKARASQYAPIKSKWLGLQASTQIGQLSEGEFPQTVEEAQTRLRDLAAILRKCSSASTALADTLLLLAHTETFFTSAKFDPVRSVVAEPRAGIGNGCVEVEATGSCLLSVSFGKYTEYDQLFAGSRTFNLWLCTLFCPFLNKLIHTRLHCKSTPCSIMQSNF